MTSTAIAPSPAATNHDETGRAIRDRNRRYLDLGDTGVSGADGSDARNVQAA
jgi:hypothetical protein